MTLKVKLISLITTFIILCSLLTVGVFAVKNTTLNVGGNIEFNVKGIEATITLDSTSGLATTDSKVIGDDILKNITLNNQMSADDVADAFAPWSGLNFAFSEEVATIKLTITNTAEIGADNYIDITATADATTKNNAKVTVANDAGGIIALLEPKQSASFTITFSVIDDEYSASLNDFLIKFDMQKKVNEDFPVLTEDMTYKTFKFRTIDGENGLSIEDIGLEQSLAEQKIYIQSEGDIEIPKYVNTGTKIYPISSIKNGAFQQSKITSISIPESVNVISRRAFTNCSSLQNIIIPDSVIEIGDVALAASSLESITIPDSVTKIGDNVFQQCSKLTSVILSSNLETISEAAFLLCSSLESITIPDSVKTIGDYAFQQCSKLTSVILSSNLETISRSAFIACSSLESITIPDSVTKIGNAAFKQCSNLIEITISDNVTTIGDYAFQDCSNLTSVILSSNLETIGYGAFAFCSTLKSVVIPDSVIGIGQFAFYNCSNLVEITLSKNLLETGSSIFSGCPNLKYNEFNNCKYLGTKDNPYFYANGVIDDNQTSYILNQNCKILGPNIFSKNSTVEEVILPDKMVSISELSFSECSSLKTINMPSKLQYIGVAAFQFCSALTNINLPDGLEFIGNYAFMHCSSAQNTKITIPSTIKQIGGTSYDPKNPDLNVIGEDVFYNVATNSLQSFEMVENEHFKVVDGVFYRKDSEGNPSVMIAYPSAKQDQKFIMPNTVVDAFGFSLSRAFNLREIVLSDNFVIRQSQEEAPEDPGWGNNLSIMNYIYSGVTTITCNDTNENYMSYNGAVYSKDGKTLYYAPMLSGLLKTDETEATLTIKEGTTSIYFGAIGRETDYSGNDVDNNLNSQNQLKRFDKIYIPSTLESIDDDTLTRINNLSWTIEIGEGNSHFKVNSSGKLEKIV